MIPVTQTKFVIKNSKDEMIMRGNCYAACIASILEKQLCDVPNVETLFHIEDNYYWQVLNKWLNSLGYEISTDDRFKVFHNGEFDSEIFFQLQDQHYIVSGQTNRGNMHACIYKTGKLVHDPHPSRDGLLTEEFFESIQKCSN